MSITMLTRDTFAAMVSDSDLLVVEFFASADSPGGLEIAAERAPQARFARIASSDEPAVAAMFGLSEGPALLIFRQEVVLYLESGEHPAERIEELLQRVQALDMEVVRAAIEEEKRAEVALRMRRVCPTARRTPLA
jgi:thioredoxin 1